MFAIMDTAFYLHILNCDLPDSFVNLIERRDQILYNVQKIDETVKMYNDIIDKMDAPVVSNWVNSYL